jgi:hypothetical protein
MGLVSLLAAVVVLVAWPPMPEQFEQPVADREETRFLERPVEGRSERKSPGSVISKGRNCS